MSVEERLAGLVASIDARPVDTGPALMEVETMAMEQKTRRRVLLAVSAALVVVAGLTWGPSLLSTSGGQTDTAVAGAPEDADGQASALQLPTLAPTQDPWGVSEVSLPATPQEAESLVDAMPDELLGEAVSSRGLSRDTAHVLYANRHYLEIGFGGELQDLTRDAEEGGGVLMGYNYDSPDLAWFTSHGEDGTWATAYFFDPATGTMVQALSRQGGSMALDRLVTEFITAASQAR